MDPFAPLEGELVCGALIVINVKSMRCFELHVTVYSKLCLASFRDVQRQPGGHMHAEIHAVSANWIRHGSVLVRCCSPTLLGRVRCLGRTFLFLIRDAVLRMSLFCMSLFLCQVLFRLFKW
jgi:hypothetical protein